MVRYGYPQCMLAERGRAFLGYTVMITGGLSAVTGLLIIIFSFVVLGVVTPYTIILKHFTNKPYMVVYLFCGVTQMLIHIFSTYFYKKASRSTSRVKLSMRGGLLLQLLWVTVILGFMVLLTCGITVGIQIKKLSDALRQGLTGTMTNYITGKTEKMTMDRMQIDFQCCGNTGPEDWFTIRWKAEEFLSPSDLARIKRTGVYHVADAPFSCCDMESPITPCQHDSVNNILVHAELHDTLNEDGCQVAMLDFFKQAILLPAALFLTSIAILGVTNALVMRFLQTSIDRLSYMSHGDPYGSSPGYLIGKSEAGATISEAKSPLDEGLES